MASLRDSVGWEGVRIKRHRRRTGVFVVSILDIFWDVRIREIYGLFGSLLFFGMDLHGLNHFRY